MKCLLPALALVWASSAWSVQVVPTSYDMPNGYTGLYNYWDDTYSGTGCKVCDGAALSGGLGDLTDGITAAFNWSVVEPPSGAGPYVGWNNVNPVINFHFGQSVQIDSVTFYFDDAGSGGVSAPSSVVIAGRVFPVLNPPGTSPFAFTASNVGFTGSVLPVTVNAGTGATWTFLSEVQFLTAVPEPAAWQMILAGCGVLVGVAMRKKVAV